MDKNTSGKKSMNGYTLDTINTLHGNLKMFIEKSLFARISSIASLFIKISKILSASII